MVQSAKVWIFFIFFWRRGLVVLIGDANLYRGLRFMCVFRFKLWWMTQRMGTCGQDIPFETQFLIVESQSESGGSHSGEGGRVGVDESSIYTVFLPILEGDFRAVLQGNERDELEICLESGKERN